MVPVRAVLTPSRCSLDRGGPTVSTLALSADSRNIAGILLLTIVGIEFGGWFMTRIVRGAVPMTDFQKSFARAGHAHAGVLVSLGLVTQILADATHQHGVLGQ